MPEYVRNHHGIEFRAIAFDDGSCPFLDWYLALQKRDQAKIEAAFTVLATATSQNRGDGGRIDNIGSETIRAIYGTRPRQQPHLRVTTPKKRDGNTFWLIHGFRKKTNKTPPRERTRAENYWARWQEERSDT